MGKLDQFMIDGTTYEIVPEIAPLFNESDSYSVGDYVIKDAVLYRFTSNHTGAWTGTDAVEVTVGREVTDLKSALNAELNPVNLTEWKVGSYLSNGTDYASDKRIRNQTKVGMSKGTELIRCDDGYKFLVLAYDAGGTCLGILKTSGSFTTVDSGDVLWLTEFPCYKYPTYEFKVALSIEPDSTSITVADGVHCYFNSMTDKTLSTENKAADAKATGNALVLKANESTIASKFSESTAYTAGQMVLKNGVLYRFTADHAGAWTGSDAVVVTVGGEVTDLRAVLNKFADSRNLFWGAKFTSGKYYYGREYNNNTQGYFVVPVVSGNTYTFGCSVRFLSSASEGIDNTDHAAGYQYTPDFTGNLYVTVYLNQSDKHVMCLSEYDVTEIGTVQNPRLAQGLLAQASGNSKTLAMSQAGTTQAVKEIAVMLDGEGQVTPGNIEGVTVTGGNVLDDAERLYSTQANVSTTDGYVAVSNGTAVIQSSTYYCSFLIPVKSNTHYTANNPIRFAVLLKNLRTSGTSPVRYSTVVGSALANITSFDTGEADHIIVSWYYNTYPINDFVISKGNAAIAKKTVNLPDWWTGGAETVKPKYISTTGDLSDGTFLALLGYKQNLRKGERYVFSGNIGTISSLHFGFTNANVFSASTTILNEFTIDATNITYKTDSTRENYTYQYAHGLTLLDNLQFIFEYLPEGNAKITLISNGVSFTQTLLFVKLTISQVVVLSTGSTLTNCKLTWVPIDIDKAVWMFGDSYLAYSSVRWTYYLQQYGYAKNALLDGWPGEGSVNARNSLMTLIQFGTPKYIVWCMGMNDGSDTDASTPNYNWTVRRDEMLTICNENGITPIFATIPNVPSILHTGKNAWIKASGYRYIDFAAAVGAESADSTWFAGMLSSDNTHPTEQGARALFARVLLDFPEIMLDV